MHIVCRTKGGERLTAWLGQFFNWKKQETIELITTDSLVDGYAMEIIRMLREKGWKIIVQRGGFGINEDTYRMFRSLVVRRVKDIVVWDDDIFIEEDVLRWIVRFAKGEGYKYVSIFGITSDRGEDNLDKFYPQGASVEYVLGFPLPDIELAYFESGEVLDWKGFERLRERDWTSDLLIMTEYVVEVWDGEYVVVFTDGCYHLSGGRSAKWDEKFYERLVEYETEYGSKLKPRIIVLD